MKKVFFIAIIIIFSRVGLFGAAVSTNEQILDSLTVEAVNELLTKQTIRFGDTLWIEHGSAPELTTTRNYIYRLRPDIVFSEIQRLPAVKPIKYETGKSLLDLGVVSGVARSISFSASWEYTDKDSKVFRLDSRKYVYADTLDYAVANQAGVQLTSKAAPSFYKQYIEPALIIASVAVVTALFFFVRSN